MKIKFFKKIVFFIIIVFQIYSYPIKAETSIKGEIIAGGILIIDTLPNTRIKLEGNIIPISQQGYGIIGFERYPKNIQILEIFYSTGEIEKIILDIKKRSYKIQNIKGVEKDKVTPPKELLERIYKEKIRVKNARKKALLIDESYYMNGFILPASGPITGVYGSQRVLNGVPKNPHYGLDIALPVGHNVMAPMDGIVLFTDKDLFYAGGTIIISHGQGLTTSYLHLSKILVEEGQKVYKGKIIGKVGATGRVTGPHLHWGVEWMGKRLDPEYLVKLLE
tara:strand:+ start:32381 stop:33214 length:834 start_codon:yes stop_codon:yes gene_type:complete